MSIEERAARWQQRINEKLAESAVMDLGAMPREVDLMMQQCRDEGFEWIDVTTFEGPAQIAISLYTPPAYRG